LSHYAKRPSAAAVTAAGATDGVASATVAAAAAADGAIERTAMPVGKMKKRSLKLIVPRWWSRKSDGERAGEHMDGFGTGRGTFRANVRRLPKRPDGFRERPMVGRARNVSEPRADDLRPDTNDR